MMWKMRIHFRMVIAVEGSCIANWANGMDIYGWTSKEATNQWFCTRLVDAQVSDRERNTWKLTRALLQSLKINCNSHAFSSSSSMHAALLKQKLIKFLDTLIKDSFVDSYPSRDDRIRFYSRAKSSTAMSSTWQNRHNRMIDSVTTGILARECLDGSYVRLFPNTRLSFSTSPACSGSTRYFCTLRFDILITNKRDYSFQGREMFVRSKLICFPTHDSIIYRDSILLCVHNLFLCVTYIYIITTYIIYMIVSKKFSF